MKNNYAFMVKCTNCKKNVKINLDNFESFEICCFGTRIFVQCNDCNKIFAININNIPQTYLDQLFNVGETK